MALLYKYVIKTKDYQTCTRVSNRFFRKNIKRSCSKNDVSYYEVIHCELGTRVRMNLDVRFQSEPLGKSLDKQGIV